MSGTVDVSKLNEHCSDLRGKLTKVETTLELECYRAEAKVRQQWEAREERLVNPFTAKPSDTLHNA